MRKTRLRKSRLDEIKLQKVIESLALENDAYRVLEGCFKEQRDFIEDPAELKGALCTRRCGKTTADAVYLIHEALKTPKVNCIYIALTRGQAKGLMLTGADAFIPKILDQYKIKARINYSELTITFNNGSVIWINGMDATPDESKKLYGNKYKLAIIDEAGAFRNDLSDLVYVKLRAAMAQGDHSGTIALTGTPENNRGFFYRITCEDEENDKREYGWSIHHWTYEANPYEREAIKLQIQDLRNRMPGIDTNPAHHLYPMFQQHYAAKWVMDRNALVYAFNARDHLIKELPPGDYTYCAGVDFGFTDAASIVVVAYRPHDPVLYVIDVFKKRELPSTEFALEIVAKDHQYNLIQKVSDHDPKTTGDIFNRFGVYLKPAEKIEKTYAITVMNADFLRNRIKIVQDPREPKCTHLIEELESLVWDKKLFLQGQKREDANCDNHCTDALLYIWRELFHFLAKPELITQEDPAALYSNLLRKRLDKSLRDKRERYKYANWKTKH